jgi:hypothetical protein
MTTLCPNLLLRGVVVARPIVTLVAVWTMSASPLAAQTGPPSSDPTQPGVAVAAPAAEPTATPTVSSIFRDVARDVGRLPSRTATLALGLGGAAGLALHTHDRRVTGRLSSSSALDPVFEPGELVGGGLVQIGAAVATYTAGRLTGHPRAAAVGEDLLRGQIINTAITQGLEFSVRRTRPDGSNYSFPSGHSSGTFTSATVLGRHFGWKVGAPAYAAATYVAVSRLQENRHVLSDVVFGAALGIAAGRTVTIGRGRSRLVVSPVASAGAAGLTFALVGER